jgi:hypothetical protein
MNKPAESKELLNIWEMMICFLVPYILFWHWQSPLIHLLPVISIGGYALLKAVFLAREHSVNPDKR